MDESDSLEDDDDEDLAREDFSPFSGYEPIEERKEVEESERSSFIGQNSNKYSFKSPDLRQS